MSGLTYVAWEMEEGMDMTHKNVVIVGLGYVGLPLAVAAASAGFKVVGLDSSVSVVDSLLSGHSHIDDLEDSDIRQLFADGFMATTDSSVIADADVVVICVPTPLALDGSPDLGPLRRAGQSASEHLKSGAL